MPAVPPRRGYWFGFTVRVGSGSVENREWRGNRDRTHSEAAFHCGDSQPTGQGPSVRVPVSAKYVSPRSTLRNRRHGHWAVPRPHCKLDSGRDSMNCHLTLISVHNDTAGLCVSMSTQTLIQYTQNCLGSPTSPANRLRAYGRESLWGRTGKVLPARACPGVAQSSCLETQPPLQSQFLPPTDTQI